MSSALDAIELDATSFGGEILGLDDPGYDVHRRIWDGSFDRRPAAIARCAGVSDVIAAVKAARANGLPVAIRSGGHSFPGYSVANDALMIDLSPLKGVRVDPERRTARVQAGVLLGELDRETQAFGLAVPSGIVTHTGVAGLTLGGGIGWIMRKYGLSVDQLVSVDLVTADGEFVRPAPTRTPSSSGVSAAAAATSGSSPSSSSTACRSGRRCSPGRSSGRWSVGRRARFLPGLRRRGARRATTIVPITGRRRRCRPFRSELHGKPVVMVVCCWLATSRPARRCEAAARVRVAGTRRVR